MLLVAETKLTIEGSVSASTTSEAVLGPKLVTFIVYVILLPIPTTATELASPRFKSARLLPPQQMEAPGEVMFKLHPLKLPESPTESSSTYKLQVPLGFVPLKIERLVP